jgi:hypothetical protein
LVLPGSSEKTANEKRVFLLLFFLWLWFFAAVLLCRQPNQNIRAEPYNQTRARKRTLGLRRRRLSILRLRYNKRGTMGLIVRDPIDQEQHRPQIGPKGADLTIGNTYVLL